MILEALEWSPLPTAQHWPPWLRAEKGQRGRERCLHWGHTRSSAEMQPGTQGQGARGLTGAAMLWSRLGRVSAASDRTAPRNGIYGTVYLCIKNRAAFLPTGRTLKHIWRKANQKRQLRLSGIPGGILISVLALLCISASITFVNRTKAKQVTAVGWAPTCQRWRPPPRCGRYCGGRAARWPGGCRPSRLWSGGRRRR